MRRGIVILSIVAICGLLGLAAIPPEKQPDGLASQPTVLRDEVFIYRGELFYLNQRFNGAVNLEFRLFAGESDEVQISPTIEAREWQVLDGRFAVGLELGDPLFLEVGAWLEVTVDGTVLSPRQFVPPPGWTLVEGEILSKREQAREAELMTGFLHRDEPASDDGALNRKDANTADNDTDAGSVVGSGSSGARDGSGATTLSGGTGSALSGRPANDPTQPQPPDSDLGEDGETMSASFIWKLRGPDIVWTRHNVGIGTRSPRAQLEIRGNFNGFTLYAVGGKSYFAGRMGIGTTNLTSRLTVNGPIESTSGGIVFPDGTTQTSAASDGGAPIDATFVTLSANEVLTEERILTPGSGLSLSDEGPGLAVTLRVANNGITTTHIVPNIVSSVDGVSNDGRDIDFRAGTNMTIEPNDDGNYITFSASGGDGHWAASGSDIYNTNSGKVGIGTSSPGAKLDVNGLGAFNQVNINGSGSATLYVAGTGVIADTLDVIGTIRSRGLIRKDNSAGSLRSYLNITTDDAGALVARGPNGNNNFLVTNLTGNANNGFLGVKDSGGTSQVGMYVNSAGDGVVFCDIKCFQMTNPEDPDTEIWYVSLEGPEPAAYIRGTGRLVNGRAVVTFPDHFLAVASPQGVTVQLTPLSADSKGLAVVDKSLDGMVVRELHGGTGTYEFDYMVTAVRQGYEDYEVIRPGVDALEARALEAPDADEVEDRQ